MKVSTENAAVEYFVILCRYPDLKGEGAWVPDGDVAWSISSELHHSISHAEQSLREYIDRKFAEDNLTVSGVLVAKAALESDEAEVVEIRGWQYAIFRLEVAEPEIPLGTDYVRDNPTRAAELILTVRNGGGDVWNAWEVLVAAVGRAEAWELLVDVVYANDSALTLNQAAAVAHEIVNEAKAVQDAR